MSGLANQAILTFHPKTGAFLGAFTSGYALQGPTKMTWGPDGDLYVSQWGGPMTVARFDGNTGAFVEEATPTIDRPMQQAWDADGRLYVASFGTGNIGRYRNGSLADASVTSGYDLQGPVNLWFAPDGTLLVVDWTGGTVERFDGSTGAYLGRYIDGLTNPEGWAYGADGRLYLADWATRRVDAFDADTGELIEIFASGGGLDDPNSVFFIDRFPDFHLAASASSLTLAPGESGDITLDVTPDRDGPFDGPVALSCVGLHEGATCAFAPSSVTPGDVGAASTLTIRAPAAGAGLTLLWALLMAGLVLGAWRLGGAAFPSLHWDGPPSDRVPHRGGLLAGPVRALVVTGLFLAPLSCGGSDPVEPREETVTRSVRIQAVSGDVTHEVLLSLTLTGVVR